MSRSLIFRIELDKPEATYEPGEEVTGKVILNIRRTTEFRQVKLEAKGECKTQWTDQMQARNDEFKSHESYFSSSDRLMGGTKKVTILPAGEHSYDFRIHLPQDIPSSFEHEYGNIRYEVKAIVDRPWRYDQTVTGTETVPLTVIAPYDLNAHPNLMVGIHDSIERSFLKYCCLDAGTIELDVKTRVNGYVSGEAIEMIIAYDNQSNNVDLIEMELKLFQVLKFTAKLFVFEDQKKIKQELGSRKLIGPFEKLGEAKLEVTVPAISPTKLEHCSFININYHLRLRIITSKMHFNIKRSYPVEIGTIPFQSETPSELQHTSSPMVDEIPSDSQRIGLADDGVVILNRAAV